MGNFKQTNQMKSYIAIASIAAYTSSIELGSQPIPNTLELAQTEIEASAEAECPGHGGCGCYSCCHSCCDCDCDHEEPEPQGCDYDKAECAEPNVCYQFDSLESLWKVHDFNQSGCMDI